MVPKIAQLITKIVIHVIRNRQWKNSVCNCIEAVMIQPKTVLIKRNSVIFKNEFKTFIVNNAFS